MTRYVRRRSAKLGQSPGTVVFAGERKLDRAHITLITYDQGRLDEQTVDDPASLPALVARPGNHWLNVDGLHDTSVVETVGGLVQAHALVLEDIVSPGQRAKVEEHGRYTFLIARMLSYDVGRRSVESEQVSFLLSDTLLVTFQERPGDVFGAVRDRLRSGKGRMRSLGVSYLAYALLDVIVDHYFVTLEAFGDELDALENDVLENPSPDIQRRLRAMRGNLVLVRRASWPIRELLSTLVRADSPRFGPDLQIFLQDAYGHVIQVVEVVESLRDVASGLTDLYLSTLSQRMNDIMKVLTIIGTIFIPLSFVAGLYGMNFDRMPELHWPYGYAFALTLMASIAGGLLFFFRRKGWL